MHLQTIHGMTAEEYRRRYAIPWRRGLVASGTHEKYSVATKRLAERRGAEILEVAALARADMRKRKPKHRPFAGWVIEEYTERLHAGAKKLRRGEGGRWFNPEIEKARKRRA